MPDIWPRASAVGWSQPPLGDCRGERRVYPGADSGKEPTCQCRRHKRFQPHSRVGKIPWRRKWQFGDLAWRIPGTEGPGRLQSMGSQRVGHDCNACCRYQIWSVLCTDTNLQPCALRAVTRGVGAWCWSVRSLPAPEPVWVSPSILMLPEGCSYKSVFTKLNVCLEVSCGIETLFALLAED